MMHETFLDLSLPIPEDKVPLMNASICNGTFCKSNVGNGPKCIKKDKKLCRCWRNSWNVWEI